MTATVMSTYLKNRRRSLLGYCSTIDLILNIRYMCPAVSDRCDGVVYHIGVRLRTIYKCLGLVMIFATYNLHGNIGLRFQNNIVLILKKKPAILILYE